MMADVEDRLREVLNRKAGDVQPLPEPPTGMLRRARRRVALTVTGGVLAATLVAAGAFLSVRAVVVAGNGLPAGHVPAPSGSVTPPLVGGCLPSSIAGVVSLDGAAGSYVGSILLTNTGSGSCVLSGRPKIELIGPGGPFDVRLASTQPWWMANQSGEPEGWPVVTLGPGDAAEIRTSWSNWCAGRPPTSWRITLSGVGQSQSVAVPVDQSAVPNCMATGSPSLVQRGPFEPKT
jgi:hypothetical protein